MKKALIIIAIGLTVIVLAIAIVFLCFPKKYNAEIDEYATKYSLPKHLVASVINIESGYDERSVSNAGAMGLMQILPSTAYDVAARLQIDITDEDLFSPEINIQLGCYYIRYLLGLFDNNVVNALCAYNWGMTNVKNWIGAGNCDSDGTIINIPVKETKDYIAKYRLNKWVYKNLYKY